MKLWHNEPAADWNEALPIGNGRLGALAFGGIGTERLDQLRTAGRGGTFRVAGVCRSSSRSCYRRESGAITVMLEWRKY
jgi:hypothetical protein